MSKYAADGRKRSLSERWQRWLHDVPDDEEGSWLVIETPGGAPIIKWIPDNGDKKA